LDPNRKVVLFLHRVARRKGAHYLPEIASMVLPKTGPVTFLVAGGGPYLEELRRIAAQQRLAGAFDFRGWVPNRDAPLYYRAADLYLMPSEEEGFPRVLLEAMAADCPFLAFDIGGVRDIISPEQEACVIPAGDRAAFAAACADALRDPARLTAWRIAGARQVERFSEERVLDAFVRMLDGRPLDWQSFRSGGDGK
jgi:glycosyltransferase involved in cell wall biosynthesis